MLCLLFPLTLLLAAAASEPNRTYYVRPDTSSTDCSANQTCLTLNQYAREQDTYFTTDSSFLFVPGNHSLELQVNLTGASNISLKSSGTIVNIICTARVAFRCKNVTGLKIKGLTFHLQSNWSLFLPSGVHYSSGLLFLNSSEVEISFSTFEGRRNSTESLVNAVISINSSLNITQCTFNGNTAYEGGAITVVQHSKIELAGNNFIKNTATRGGALYTSNSSVVLTSSGNTFFDNQADESGGAIYLEMSSAIMHTGTNFTQNKATWGNGGALSLGISSILLKGIHTFANNEASRCGGAIDLFDDSNATIDGETDFTRNEAYMGGVFCVSDFSSIVLKSGVHTFADNEASQGGAIYLIHSNATIYGDINFTRNDGGALYAVGSSLVLKAGIHTFSNNSASDGGGAITLYWSRATINGDTRFTGNNASGILGGGALYVKVGSVVLKGTHTFDNNKATGYAKMGGAIALFDRSTVFIDGEANFTGNAADNGGAIAIFYHSTVFIDGETNFTGNTANDGGAIFLEESRLTIDSETNFIRNEADHGGALFGAVSFIVSRVGLNIFFTDNAAHHGGAIFLKNSKLSTGAPDSGHSSGVVASGQGSVVLRGRTVFAGNTANSGGAIYSLQDQILFNTTVSFLNNLAHSEGGALYLGGSKVNFSRDIVFTSNSARNGGAVYITRSANLYLVEEASFSSSYNHARGYGGVIYHNDSTVTQAQCNSEEPSLFLPSCFLQIDNYFVPIHWHQDSADRGGSFLFGGLLDMCMWNDCLDSADPAWCCDLDNDKLFDTINSTTAIASDPYRLYFCESNRQIRNWEVTVYRGETFLVPVIALSQGGRVTSAEVTAVVSNSARVELHQTHQPLPNNCTELAYNLYSSKSNESLQLHIDGPCRGTGLAKIEVLVTLLDCPDGFTQQDEECVCEERLQVFDINCTVKNGIHITKKAGTNFWMNTLYKNGTYQGLILYHSCPLEYCKTATVRVPLTDLDQQCAHNRSGLLCGACATNYSLLLGGSRCAECSNSFLAFLLAFVLAGVALVALLTFLKLTVATGMINGVILYANFVQVNRKLFFPINTTNILTVFIAWLNLDLGFETCFYAGMDAYAQTWLQYAFPIYLWMLMSLIVLISRYSVIFSRVIGSNPVAVLATLLLMSYTKVLRIIIEVFSSVQLDYPHGEKVTVWLKDANVSHLKGKHLMLTVFTSLFVIFVFAPYTVVLLLNRQLYRLPSRVCAPFLVKLKPLLDSYTAPYKRNTYYWTGFLLVVRCVLYIIFSVNSLGNASKSLLAITITFTGIIVLFACRRVYTSFYVNVLEVSLCFNLVVLSASTLADSNQAVLSHTLVGIAFVTTLGIMLYCFHLHYMATSTVWAKLKLQASALKDKVLRTATVPSLPPAPVSLLPVTHSTIDLRESLLDSNESISM